MRVLIVGTDCPGALELFFFKYLKEAGVEINIFDAQGQFLRFYGGSLLNKFAFRAGISGIYKKINSELISFSNQFEPEIILVFKGMEILPHTLNVLRSQGIKLINYNPDNPFLFTGRGSGNGNITQSIELYHLHLTYNLEVLKEFSNRNIPAKWLPFGYDVSDSMNNELKRLKEIRKACFIGTADRQRAFFFNELASKGVEVDIYGSRWEKFKLHKNLHLSPPVYGMEFWSRMHQYRVQINVLRKHNIHSHGMRSFEVPGAGGIQLANDTPEHRFFFEPGQEIFLFKDMDECVQMVNWLLSLSEDEVKSVREKSRERSVMSKYSYYHRANELFNILKETQE